MSPIRIGIIGLSTSSQSTSWATRAHLPYLQSPQGQKNYEIVALCNSSVASAQKSIEQFKLSSSVKAYGSPADLANDPDVDLVVNVTGVERHHEVLLPSVEAGKNIFTELPLASNVPQMKELLQKAEEKNIRTAFGMQGQTNPVVKLVKDTIEEGKIGKVLSSTWVGAASFLGEKPLPVGIKSFTQRKVGANMMSVTVLHSINYIIATLGDVSTFHSILGNQRPSIVLIDPAQGGKQVEIAQKDTPDQVFLQARLNSGALLSYHLRGGDPFPGEPGVLWTIYGEKGEIRITNPMSLLDIVHGGVSIKLHEFGQEKAQDLQLPEDDMSGLEHPAQNVGRIYEAYAKGNVGGDDGCPDWKMGWKRHALLEEMWKRGGGEDNFGQSVGVF